MSLLYSNEQRSIKEVSSLVRLSRRSLERFFNAWELASDKYSTLSIATGRGAKIKLLAVKDLLPNLVKEHSRNLNPILEDSGNISLNTQVALSYNSQDLSQFYTVAYKWSVSGLSEIRRSQLSNYYNNSWCIKI